MLSILLDGQSVTQALLIKQLMNLRIWKILWLSFNTSGMVIFILTKDWQLTTSACALALIMIVISVMNEGVEPGGTGGVVNAILWDI
jgi:hypothetical protein